MIWERIKRWFRDVIWQYEPDYYTRVVTSPAANAMTADQLIAANLIQSFINDFDDWYTGHKPHYSEFTREAAKSEFTWRQRWSKPAHPDLSLINRVLRNDKKDVTLFWKHTRDNFFINDLPFKEGEKVVEAFVAMQTKMKEIRKENERIRKEMAENEAKWNLAENLTGLTRNKAGALVPFVRGPDTKDPLPEERSNEVPLVDNQLKYVWDEHGVPQTVILNPHEVYIRQETFL